MVTVKFTLRHFYTSGEFLACVRINDMKTTESEAVVHRIPGHVTHVPSTKTMLYQSNGASPWLR